MNQSGAARSRQIQLGVILGPFSFLICLSQLPGPLSVINYTSCPYFKVRHLPRRRIPKPGLRRFSRPAYCPLEAAGISVRLPSRHSSTTIPPQRLYSRYSSFSALPLAPGTLLTGILFFPPTAPPFATPFPSFGSNLFLSAASIKPNHNTLRPIREVGKTPPSQLADFWDGRAGHLYLPARDSQAGCPNALRARSLGVQGATRARTCCTGHRRFDLQRT